MRSRRTPLGLPRERGDGPAPRRPLCASSAAPPRTRGWTGVDVLHEPQVIGSPANAGMDPSPDGPAKNDRGLPRERGDGPTHPVDRRGRIEAPPRTRGWTLRSGREVPIDAGSPANAGMDRSTRPAAARSSRLPRERGDGPWHFRLRTTCIMAPPRTRGWTQPVSTLARAPGGSPANAGMDRATGRRIRVRSWLPRERGDGPASWPLTTRPPTAPPRTRGWTAPRALRGSRRLGSPANAGMDPSGTRRGSRLRRLPRERGDGPGNVLHARSEVLAPPRTRGWTAVDRRWRGRDSGSPANAGMDLRLWGWGLVIIRLPRERGDGPVCTAKGRGRSPAPPRTRGWT